MPHLLQINYKSSVPRAEFEKGFDAVAAQIAQVPGLRWKIWLLNQVESRGGGIYLFDDEESARAYLEGPIIAAMKSLPILSELSVTSSSVLEEPTAITRGSIEETLVRRQEIPRRANTPRRQDEFENFVEALVPSACGLHADRLSRP